MTTQQPEALRLAGLLRLESESERGGVKYSTAKQSEKELRRLHAENEALKQKIAATQSAAQGMEALTIVEKLPRYTYGYKSDEWGMNRCLRAYQDNAGTFLMRDEVLAALAAQAKQGGK